MGRLAACTAALSFALAAPACSDGEDPPPAEEPDVQTAYLDVYLDEAVRPCGQQLEAYDRFLERVFELWTGLGPGDFRTRLEVGYDACNIAPSCASPAGVWLGGQFGEYHELAHAMHFATDGTSAISLSEGVAQAFGPGHPLPGESYTGEELSVDVLFERHPTASDYGPYALFVRFLIERHGVEAFRAYFRAMKDPEHRSPEDFEREFERTFGAQLDDTWEEYRSDPDARCAYDFWYCDRRWPIEVPFSIDALVCDDPDALGFEAPVGDGDPANVPFSPMRIFHVDVASPTTLQVDIENANVTVGRCGDCIQQQPAPWPGIGSGPLEVDVGTYVFIISRIFEDAPTRFAISEIE